MSQGIKFIVDGVEIEGQRGQTILEACEDNGVYIPRLCHMKGLTSHGSCRVCSCMVNGRAQAACSQPIAPGMVIENESERVTAIRKNLIEMLFVEGNHYCMFCEKSGNCELQALAYRFGITAPKYPYLFPERDVDPTHPDIFVDHNRCVLCGRCVRTSKEKDGKNIFQFVGRGPHKKVSVNAEGGLAETNAQVTDEAVEACPVGAILKKRTGYRVPVGERIFDHEPIGSEVEKRRAGTK